MSVPRRPVAGRPVPPARPLTVRGGSGAGRRPGGRPAARVQPRSQGRGAPAEPGPRTSRGRVLVLLLLVGGLALSAALPLREYLSQRGEINALRHAQTDRQARVAELEAERTRLQDPAYVAAQARRRLHYVLPGETAYVLILPSAAPEAAVRGGGPTAPWWSQVWGTVQEADRPSPAPTP